MLLRRLGPLLPRRGARGLRRPAGGSPPAVVVFGGRPARRGAGPAAGSGGLLPGIPGGILGRGAAVAVGAAVVVHFAQRRAVLAFGGRPRSHHGRPARTWGCGGRCGLRFRLFNGRAGARGWLPMASSWRSVQAREARRSGPRPVLVGGVFLARRDLRFAGAPGRGLGLRLPGSARGRPLLLAFGLPSRLLRGAARRSRVGGCSPATWRAGGVR